jgi:hypothetical protein
MMFGSSEEVCIFQLGKKYSNPYQSCSHGERQPSARVNPMTTTIVQWLVTRLRLPCQSGRVPDITNVHGDLTWSADFGRIRLSAGVYESCRVVICSFPQPQPQHAVILAMPSCDRCVHCRGVRTEYRGNTLMRWEVA